MGYFAEASMKSGRNSTTEKSGDYLPLGDGVTVMLPYDKEGEEVSPPEV